MSSAELADLRERVRRLEAVEIAREHVHSYARTLDEPRPEAVAALFAPDAVLVTPSRKVRGVAPIREFFVAAFAADPSIKRHFVTNVRTSWLGDSRVRVDSQFLFTGRGAERSLVGWGVYDDIVDVGGPVPLFTEKVIAVEVSADAATGWSRDRPAR